MYYISFFVSGMSMAVTLLAMLAVTLLAMLALDHRIGELLTEVNHFHILNYHKKIHTTSSNHCSSFPEQCR